MDKADAINAIAGLGFPNTEVACEMTNLGLARFTGNQWNENLDWDRKALEALGTVDVNQIYRALRNYQVEAV